MRAVWIAKHGGPEVLEVRETEDPAPGDGEVLVRVRAAGLNFAEISARMGIYPDAPKPPCVVGYEIAGEVDTLGPGVDGPAPGTRVLAMVRFGGHADRVVVPAGVLHPIPEGLSFEEAAALPVNYLTAHHMLFQVANIQPGESILVHMAAGGVGLAVLQLCRTVPDLTVFGTSSASKHEILRELGCDHPIDYRTVDYADEVRRLTDDRGVHVVLDALGGKDWRKGYDLLRPIGRLVAFGFANLSGGPKASYLRVASQMARTPFYNPMSLMNANKLVAGVHMGHLWGEAERMGRTMAALLTLVEEGAVRPRVDGIFPFDEAADAHRYIQERKNVGKVVLVP